MGHSIKWSGPPRSYGLGRARTPRYVTLHYTAGSEGGTSAENGANYDKNRTDGTSCHYFTDSNGPALQMVHDEDTAYSALYKGNAIGIHIEICGTNQSRSQWLDEVSKATLDCTAWLVAQILIKFKWPCRRLTVEQTRQAWYAPGDERHNYQGINDHGTVTAAYPEDGGDHTDLGPNFPWDVFMPMVESYMEGDVTAEENWAYPITTLRTGPNGENETKPAQDLLKTARYIEVNDIPAIKTKLAEMQYDIDALLAREVDVTLSDAQLETLADKVAVRLRALTFVAEVPDVSS